MWAPMYVQEYERKVKVTSTPGDTSGHNYDHLDEQQNTAYLQRVRNDQLLLINAGD